MRNRDVIAILVIVLLFVAGAVFLTESNHKKKTDPDFRTTAFSLFRWT